MKVDLISKSGRLQLHGATIAVKPNGFNPVQLRAELEEGESPVEIIVQNGHRRSFPVKSLTIINNERVMVRAHVRHYKSGRVTVAEHWMRKRLPNPERKRIIAGSVAASKKSKGSA